MSIEEELAHTLDQHHHVYDSDRGMDFGCTCEAIDEYESDEEHPRHLAQILAPLLNRVRAEALREAADHLEATTELLNPNRGSELAYINCTRIDARELRELADNIEQNSEGKS